MRRAIDWDCAGCGRVIADALADENEARECPDCHAQMLQVWWRTRQRAGEWGDADAVLVFRDHEGKIRYPGRTDVQPPAGYEAVRLRSLRAVEKFEKDHAVRSEMAWFDKGSGRGHDDHHGNQKLTH
jgi:hypothetical protein